MISPVQFVQQVKREIAKVTWPTRKEVTVSTIMVFILAMLAAGFFLLTDQILMRIIRFLLQLGV